MENLKQESVKYSEKYYKSNAILEPNDHFLNGALHSLILFKEDIELIKDIIGRRPKNNEPDYINEIWKILDKY